MTEPVVSIVMPCYQNGATLEQTVRSVQLQTFEGWELIAVNDGSTDDTGERLRALAKEEPRLRVLHQENGGVSRARNAGLAAARGEWVFFVDADDLLTADALSVLLAMTDAETDTAWAGERLVNAALAFGAGEHFRWKELIGHDNPNKSVPPDEAELAKLRDEYAAALAECGRA